MNTVKPMYKWDEIPWHKLEKKVYKLQKRIYKASSRGDVKLVRRLQKLLTNSWGAKCLAVRRVTQENQGRKTAGVDGFKELSPKQRLTLINKIKLGTKASPTRRVWIPKPGNQEKRPLGIPTMYDRALQGLVKLVLEPEWEAQFEPNSYGFRPGRGCHDAIEAIFNSIRYKPKYVLDADIAKCFDRISHGKLLKKLNTFPTLRRQIRAWLKAGVMDGKTLFPTNQGTPQGGVLSPLLANIALHGMEERIKKYAETFDIKAHNSKYQISPFNKRQTIFLIRYADDFVVFHESLDLIKKAKDIISEWLSELDLELKPSKTRISHTLMPYSDEKPGLNFLGFHIFQYKAGKCKSGKFRGKLLGFRTSIRPSKEAQQRHYSKIAKVIERNKGVSQDTLINILNPIITGWCNYYKPFQSKKVFKNISNLVYFKLWKWGIRRHRNKGRKWLRNKYWKTIGKDTWRFCSNKHSNLNQLIKHQDIPTNVGYVKVKGEVSPYNGDLIYWSSRMGRHPLMPKRKALLLKKQKGKCNWCELIFRETNVIEIDHIRAIAAGGKDEYKNLQLLHRHCHDKKTKSDLEMIHNHQRDKRIDDFYKWFNKLNWRWDEDIPTMI